MKCVGMQLKIGCVPMQFVPFPSGRPDAWLQCMYLPFHLPVSTYSYFNVCPGLISIKTTQYGHLYIVDIQCMVKRPPLCIVCMYLVAHFVGFVAH